MSNEAPIKLAYSKFEPTDGVNDSLSPIIFLHGITGTKEYWKDIPQIIANKTKRRTYATDARNHGDSEYTDSIYKSANADDLLFFMDTNEIPKAILIGHSMGGVTAIHAALQKPERVEAIIVEDMYTKKCPKEMTDMTCGFISLWLMAVQSIPKTFTEDEAVSFAVDFLYAALPPNVPHLPDKEKLRNGSIGFKRTPEGNFDVRFNKKVVLDALRSYSSVNNEPSGQYDGAAYFIYGELSPFQVGKEEEDIKKHFPQAELFEVKGSGHNVHMEFPEEFSQIVLKCLLK